MHFNTQSSCPPPTNSTKRGNRAPLAPKLSVTPTGPQTSPQLVVENPGLPTPPCRKRAKPDPLTPSQSKLPSTLHGLMCPRNNVLQHPAAKLLLKWATDGCPVDCGQPWSKQAIQAAIDKAAHPSAQSLEAATSCRNEALERVKDKCARLVKWDDIKHNPPINLKISPIAAIPHKSRAFRMILDLSYNITVNGTKLASVNKTSNKELAPQHAMYELGNVIPRIVWTLATADPSMPFLFTKIDLKDGYWRMCVNAKDAWNFAYVLPKLRPDEPTRLVVPDALQMGWSESPPFFCAATETARDVALKTIEQNASLDPHPLENILLNSTAVTSLPKRTTLKTSKFVKLLEVYIDDFIGLIQASSIAEVCRFTRAVLHAIYNTFPPPELTNSDMGPPISEQKLTDKGVWETQKEILGWTFDGIHQTIELAPAKCNKLQQTIKDTM